MINIDIEDKVKFKVEGTMNTAGGTPKAFAFSLICERLGVDAYKERVGKDDSSFADFLASVVQGWEGVQDGEGTPVEFSEAGLRKLCKVPGLAQLMFVTYGLEAGAKQKN